MHGVAACVNYVFMLLVIRFTQLNSRTGEASPDARETSTIDIIFKGRIV